MKLPELAEYLQVPQSALYRLATAKHNGGFPALKVGRSWRFDLEQVQDWLLRAWERQEESKPSAKKRSAQS